MMKTTTLLVLVVTLLSADVFGQNNDRRQVSGANNNVREGLRIYQQKCAVCHVPPTQWDKAYASRLGRHVVATKQKEDASRSVIANGLGRSMPGWKYTLTPGQIDAVIAYLKTVE